MSQADFHADLVGDRQQVLGNAFNQGRRSDLGQSKQHIILDVAHGAGNGWDDQEAIQHDGAEFNGPSTRLEFLDVEGNSDQHEQFLNRPLSQEDLIEAVRTLAV